MSEIRDSGRFVFNEKNPVQFLREGQLIPSKPDNMENDTEESESYSPDGLYTYSMGINQIEANNNTYEESSVFVTKPIALNENVLEVTLNALEEHPVFDEVSGRAAVNQTSIEYYIAIKDNPSPNDWISILPRETKEVKGERLFFDGINAETLFPFQLDSVRVYKDGLIIEKPEYYVLNTQSIQVEHLNRDAIYTIDYTPNTFASNPYIIEINDYKYDIERMTEEFDGTDINKTLTLNHVPYIDKEKLLEEEDFNPNTSQYRPVDVSIVDASIQAPNGRSVNYVPPTFLRDGEPYMANKTLYLDNSWSELQRYNLETGYLGIDYFQNKNKITLAEHINIPMIEENERETPGTGTIRVSYDALVTEFRLKVILRRNTQKEITATPRLKEYQLNFKSIR